MEITKLLEDRIAVRPDAPETKTKGGIITPNPQGKGRGTVVACGPGKRIPWDTLNTMTDQQKSQRMTVKVSDVVLYGRFTGGEIAVGGESLLLMRECDIVAVIDTDSEEKSDERSLCDQGKCNCEPPHDVGEGEINDDYTPLCGCGKKPRHFATNCPNAKTTYNACCGADCDCTPCDGEDGDRPDDGTDPPKPKRADEC